MTSLRSRVQVLLAELGAVAMIVACASAGSPENPPQGAEAVSLLGRPLVAPEMPPEVVARVEGALRQDLSNPELVLAAGSALATAWRFREAIAMYSRGIAIAPDDARFYRFRGHRYITVRRFADAARDLDRAATFDSTDFDIAYHRGLAHYLLGHFDVATATYAQCLAFATNETQLAREAQGAFRQGYRSCMRTATDVDSRASMSDWYWRALMRAGRTDDANRLLDAIGEGLTVTSNISYYENLLMYKGRRTPSQVMAAASSDSVRFATSGYAVANYYFLKGDAPRGRALLQRVATSPHWNGFGVIAAEVDLLARR
jgi:tetratricopeptide (TPR) repeat protein